MALQITIEICERGSVVLHHVGDLRLLTKHARCVESVITELEESANLDVNPMQRKMNVLERFLYGVPKIMNDYQRFRVFIEYEGWKYASTTNKSKRMLGEG
jgi:hypothetical protein